MSDFDAFLASLSDEQKAKLMQGLMEASEKPPAQVPTRDLPSRKEAKQPQPAVVVNEDFTVTRTNDLETRKQPVRAKKNQWSDSGEDRDENYDAEKFEKMGRTARARAPQQKVTVECHICGKNFKIHKDSIYGEFIRCDRCTGR